MVSFFIFINKYWQGLKRLILNISNLYLAVSFSFFSLPFFIEGENINAL